LSRNILTYEESHKFINGVLHKLCNFCWEWLPCIEENFYPNNKNKQDGLYPYCIECTKIKSTKWQNDNHEKYLKIREKYRSQEPFKILNREFSKVSRLEGKQKEYIKNNPEKSRKYSSDRYYHKKHKISNKEWLACKEYFNNSCCYCDLEADKHFVKYRGELRKQDLHKEHFDDDGKNDLSNCIPSCQSCNSSKWKFTFKEWYNKNNPNFTQERYDKILKWINEDYKKYKEIKK
jgi:hypothetical protein